MPILLPHSNESRKGMAIEVLVPSTIKIGGGAIFEASSILKRLEVNHPLIVTDAFLMRVGPV
jgi:alcohol dehydrogenase class IV